MTQINTNIISDFRGEFSFLSNFYPSLLIVDIMPYPTLEHAFQAMKTSSLEEREKIRIAGTAREAKKLGRRVTLVPNWDVERLSVMENLVTLKFTTHLDLKIKLLMTGKKDLVEGNTWNDRFWGISNGVGENHLGKILMKVRETIRASEGSAQDVFYKFLDERNLNFLAEKLDFLFKNMGAYSLPSGTDLEDFVEAFRM